MVVLYDKSGAYFLHHYGLVPEELLGDGAVEQVADAGQLLQEVVEELATVLDLLVVLAALNSAGITMLIFF